MQRWEYKVVALRDQKYTAALNEFGLDGWELVNVVSEAVAAPGPEHSGAVPLPRVFGRLEEAADKLNKLGQPTRTQRFPVVRRRGCSGSSVDH